MFHNFSLLIYSTHRTQCRNVDSQVVDLTTIVVACKPPSDNWGQVCRC